MWKQLQQIEWKHKWTEIETFVYFGEMYRGDGSQAKEEETWIEMERQERQEWKWSTFFVKRAKYKVECSVRP